MSMTTVLPFSKLTDIWKYGKTMPSVVDQLEIQRLCRDCHAHPLACFMKILAEILEIEDATVLDLTYGIGEFYRYWHPRYLVAFDVVDWRKRNYRFVYMPDEFYETSFINAPQLLGDRRFDVVVFDPPYNIKPAAGLDTPRGRPWLYHGRENLRLIVKHFPGVAKRYATRLVIVKFMDSRDVTVFDLVREFGRVPDNVVIWRRFRRYIPRRNVKIIKIHTYFLIWKL